MTRFLKVFLATFLTLGLLFLALPALLLLADVPPFRIGDHLLLSCNGAMILEAQAYLWPSTVRGFVVGHRAD